MVGLTAAVSLVGCAAIWLMRPSRGLIVYLLVLCLYPQYLAISIATIDFTSARLVGLMLLLRIVTYRAQPPAYSLLWMDIFVVGAWLGRLVAHLTTGPFETVIVREAGQFFDFVLPYFLVRYSVRTREDVFGFFRWITLIAVPLAVVGVFHSLTGTNPYAFMRAYSPWEIGAQELDVRYGLYRADGPFGNKISFGLFFAMALAMHCGVLFGDRLRIGRWVTQAGFICLGLISSMSSAPLFAAVTTMGWVGVRPLRRFLPYVFAAFLACVLAIELYSDRHFYHVLTRFAWNKANAYYRIELFEEAFGGGMDGHWVTGYGYVGVGPGTDNTNFHWRRKDFVNLYIGRLATGGLVSLLPFMALNIYYYFALYKAHKLAHDFRTHWMIWCLTAGMIGWNVGMMTVGALQQIQMLFAMLLGIIAAWLRMLALGEAHEPLPAPDPVIAPPPEPVTGTAAESYRTPRESMLNRLR